MKADLLGMASRWTKCCTCEEKEEGKDSNVKPDQALVRWFTLRTGMRALPCRPRLMRLARLLPTLTPGTQGSTKDAPVWTRRLLPSWLRQQPELSPLQRGTWRTRREKRPGSLRVGARSSEEIQHPSLRRGYSSVNPKLCELQKDFFKATED